MTSSTATTIRDVNARASQEAPTQTIRNIAELAGRPRAFSQDHDRFDEHSRRSLTRHDRRGC